MSFNLCRSNIGRFLRLLQNLNTILDIQISISVDIITIVHVNPDELYLWFVGSVAK